MSFPYKAVLVVGATSGIGLALAEKMIANGSHVIALGRRQERLDELVQKYGKDKVSSVKFDITDLKGIPGLVESVTKQHPDLDCVVLNSGMQRALNFTHPESIDLNLISEEFNTNYISYIHFTKYFLPFLQNQKSKTSLVFVTSALALVPLVRCGNYCASKAALHHLVLVMREQLKDSNVKIIEILPPAVQTELHDARHQPDIKDGRSVGMPLDEFMDGAWQGLMDEKEQIPIGMSQMAYDGFEYKRQEIFQTMVKRVGGKP